MGMPIEPIPKSHVSIARLFRWVFFVLCIGGLGYLMWGPYGLWGVALVAVSAILWAIEIFRADGTENYIFENYEDPRS